MKNNNFFKENLKMLRKEQELGQVQLSKLIGVSKSSISYWETGKQEPTLTALIKLADFFNVSLDYLVGRTD